MTERDSRVSYSSPALVPVGDKLQIVCSSSGSLDGYDPQTGERLWTYSEDIGGNRAATPLPCGDGRFVIAASPGMHNENESEARQSNGLVVIEPTPTGFAPRVFWRTGEAMPSFNTPTIHEGIAYWVNRAGVLFAFDAETGSELYAKRAGQTCWATPIVIGDRLYIFGKDGKTAVVRTGREYELLVENQLWDVEQLGSEDQARQRAADGGSRHREHAADTEGSEPKSDEVDRTAGPRAQRPAGEDSGRSGGDAIASGPSPGSTPGRGVGGRPAMTPEQEAEARRQGEDRFSDPVQYGVAIVSGSLVIRTGEKVYCIRSAAEATGAPTAAAR
ncbi:MAG: PQQ-binding-like beta-propeller repeat protein [Planctomycetaceae bacterium]